MLDLVQESFNKGNEVYCSPGKINYYYHAISAAYFRHKGHLDSAMKLYREARKHLSAVEDNGEEARRLAFGRACTLVNQGFFLKAREEVVPLRMYAPNATSIGWIINYLSGVLETHSGNYSKARPLLFECLSTAKTEHHSSHIAMAAHAVGYMRYCETQYIDAIEHFDMSIERTDPSHQNHWHSLYYKALSMSEFGNNDAFKNLVEHGKALSKGDTLYETLFRAAECLMDIKNMDNLDFLYSAVFKLQEFRFFIPSMYYCDVLLEHMPEDSEDINDIKKIAKVLRLKVALNDRFYKGGDQQ